MFGFQHNKKIRYDLDYFLSFLNKYEEKNLIDMFYLILDHRFKTLHLVSSFVGCEQGKAIMEEHDKKSLFHIFL
jgi:hypothetical protein